MPLLEVTGGPVAPSGKTLAAGTRLVAIYDSPYVDGIYSYPTNHLAELDLTTDRWKPMGAPDGTAFYLPGGADTYPVPPRVTLHEIQVYDDATQQSFVRNPMIIIATSEGQWFYSTPPAGIKFLDNPNVPATAVLQSQRDQPGGFAGLTGEGVILSRLAYEDEPDGVAVLNESGRIPYPLEGFDFEAGTFSPQFQSTGTQPSPFSQSTQGRYIRIGRLAFVWGNIYINSRTGGSGKVRVINLPFVGTPAGNPGYISVIANNYSSQSGYNTLYFQVMEDDTTALFYEMDTDGMGNIQEDITKINTGDVFMFSGMYEIWSDHLQQ